MKRTVAPAVLDCPLGDIISLENCKKCPAHTAAKKEEDFDCGKLSSKEMKMQAEPATQKEYTTKW